MTIFDFPVVDKEKEREGAGEGKFSLFLAEKKICYRNIKEESGANMYILDGITNIKIK